MSSLFAKYKNTLKPPQATVQKKTVELVAQVMGINLLDSQVSYKTTTRTLKINAPSVIRSEILRRKHELLVKLTQELGVTNAPTEIV